MAQKIIVSNTAYSRGFGSVRWKTVSGLTKGEKNHARNGGVVLFTGNPRSGGGNGTGTTVREVVAHSNGKFYHRVPSADILRQAGLEGE